GGGGGNRRSGRALRRGAGQWARDGSRAGLGRGEAPLFGGRRAATAQQPMPAELSQQLFELRRGGLGLQQQGGEVLARLFEVAGNRRGAGRGRSEIAHRGPEVR